MFPIIFRGLLFSLKTRTGRRLALLGLLSAWRLARHRRARMAYAHAWRIASYPPRRAVGRRLARKPA